MKRWYRFPIMVYFTEDQKQKELIGKELDEEDFQEGWVDIDLDSIVAIFPQQSSRSSGIDDVCVLYTTSGKEWEVLVTPEEMRTIFNYTPFDVKEILQSKFSNSTKYEY